MTTIETILFGIVQLEIIVLGIALPMWLIHKFYGIEKLSKKIDKFIDYIESVFNL